MLIRRMIDHQVHHQLHPPLVNSPEHPVKILHRAEFFHDCPVVADIIPVVIIRRLVYGRKPEHIHPQFLQVIQF